VRQRYNNRDCCISEACGSGLDLWYDSWWSAKSLQTVASRWSPAELLVSNYLMWLSPIWNGLLPDTNEITKPVMRTVQPFTEDVFYLMCEATAQCEH